MIISREYRVRFPVWALPLAFNDDADGIAQDDVNEYRAWLAHWSDYAARYGCCVDIDIDIDAVPFFSWSPTMGDHGCECVDATLLFILDGGAL